MSEPQLPLEIPAKVYFRIGEVAELAGVKAYVLRFWEDEFPALRPQKSRSGQRRYRRTDVELILRIRELLWERKFTIAGARDELRGGRDHLRTSVVGQQALPITAAEPLLGPSSPSVGGEVTVLTRAELSALRNDLVALRERVRALAATSP